MTLTREQREAWREDAERNTMPLRDHLHARILALLDALDAAEAIPLHEAEKAYRAAIGWQERALAAGSERDELSAWIEEHALVKTLAQLEAAEAERDEAVAKVARVEALIPDECWVSRTVEVRCIDFVGGTFPNGTAFTEGACCLPCRLRAALDTPATDEGGE